VRDVQRRPQPQHLGESGVGGQPAFPARVWRWRTAGNDAGMDDRVAHFFVSVGRLCGDARVGGLVVRLTLVSGEEIVGVPAPPRETDGADELDGTGYADAVTVDGVAVPLSDVIEASVAHPEPPTRG
jgi:hypothetical protein